MINKMMDSLGNGEQTPQTALEVNRSAMEAAVADIQNYDYDADMQEIANPPEGEEASAAQVSRAISGNGYVTIVCNGRSWSGHEIRNLQMLEEMQVDAVVIIGGTLDQINWEEFPDFIQAVRNISGKIPCVLGSERAADLGCCGVYVDAAACVEELVAHLAEQGYRRMGILGGLSSVYPSEQLKWFLREAAAEYGMELRPQWQINSSCNSMDGAGAMKKLLQQEELPEVVCCINDEIAVGAMGAALDAGLKIPQDIAFTGYDGVWLGREFRPRLTTVQIDFDTMGHRLVETVLGAINGSREQTVIPIAPWLEIRESTRA